MNQEQSRKEAAEKYAYKMIPNPQKYDAPYISTLDRFRDLQDAHEAGAQSEAEREKWIEVKSKEDLPTKEGTYFVYSNTDYSPFFRVDVFCGRLSNAVHHITDKPLYTHYQPIVKPTPPKTSK